MPLNKPKPLGQYPLVFHDGLEELLAKDARLLLVASDEATCKNARSRWRVFLRVAKAGGRYCDRLRSVEIRTKMEVGADGRCRVWLTSEHGRLEALANFLQSNSQ